MESRWVQGTEVTIDDISRAYTLFVDVKRSTQYLIEFQEQYMYNEVPDMGDGGDEEANMET